MSIAQTEKIEVFPSNRPAANAAYSNRNGSGQIRFSLGSMNRWLVTSSVRLNFKLKLHTPLTAAATEVTGKNYPNNDDAYGTTTAALVQQNPKIASMACIQSIAIQAGVQNSTLERIDHYPRLLATLLAGKSNFKDYACHLQEYYGATSSQLASARMNNSVMEVSAPLVCGLFMPGATSMMPLGQNGVNGLTIVLNLAQGIAANYGANAERSYFEISEPTLSCVLATPVGGVLPPIKNMPYYSFESYYSVLNNGDETQNINMGLGRVVSIFSNSVPTDHISNTTQDGNATPPLRNAPYGSGDYAPVTRYTVLRGGVRYPYQYSVDENALVSGIPGAYTSGFEAQRQKNFLSALMPYRDMEACLSGPLSEANNGATPVGSTNYNTEGDAVWGIGARMDQAGIGAAASYVGKSFSQRVQSKLDGLSPNSLFTMALHANNISFDNRGDTAVSS